MVVAYRYRSTISVSLTNKIVNGSWRNQSTYRTAMLATTIMFRLTQRLVLRQTPRQLMYRLWKNLLSLPLVTSLGTTLQNVHGLNICRRHLRRHNHKSTGTTTVCDQGRTAQYRQCSESSQSKVSLVDCAALLPISTQVTQVNRKTVTFGFPEKTTLAH